jgi:nitroreductase
VDEVASLAELRWQGVPNQLSPRHAYWPIIDDVTSATVKPQTAEAYGPPNPVEGPSPTEAIDPSLQISLRQIIHQRRSAVAMDGRTDITRDTFYRILSQTLACSGQGPFNTLPWSPRVDLALFVHRVQEIEPGLYSLVRDPARKEVLASSMKAEFLWEKPEACPSNLDLYRLMPGDARALARQVSCHQSIASDGCFSLGMIAEFERSIDEFGAWFYPRLYWECGAVGQALYLAAEAAGVRGTGIGCFFDDPVHSLLGLDLGAFSHQSLYHFTVGGALEDKRLMTLPAYPDT